MKEGNSEVVALECQIDNSVALEVYMVTEQVGAASPLYRSRVGGCGWPEEWAGEAAGRVWGEGSRRI